MDLVNVSCASQSGPVSDKFIRLWRLLANLPREDQVVIDRFAEQ